MGLRPTGGYSQDQASSTALPDLRTNVQILGDLAIGCIGEVPDTLSSFLLESTGRMPYLRPSLTGYWRSLDKQVFVSDSVSEAGAVSDLFRLSYDPEEAQVAYQNADDAKLRRVVRLAIQHSLVAPSGLLLDDGRCRDEYTDVISRQAVALLERDPYPETRGQVPTDGGWRDWAEPVVLAASVGLVAYLFFSIRSS